MAYGSDPREQYSYGAVTPTNNRRFRQSLGLPSIAGPAPPTLERLQSEVGGEPADELAEMGRAIKTDLNGTLDASLLSTELAEAADAFTQFPTIREMGVPEYGETPYRELTPAAWRLKKHLKSVGFFTSAEENTPSFSSDLIEETTKQLLRMESLTETLSTLGFTDHEQMALVTNIVNSSDQLSWWETTIDYPSVADVDEYEDGVEYEYVPPLYERAMAGALLWIDGLDWWLWQNEILITDEMLEYTIWDVKSMLAGVYLLGDAALRVAEGTIDDEDLTTLITTGTAISIIGQEFLAEDIAWIDDDDRAPLEDAHDEV